MQTLFGQYVSSSSSSSSCCCDWFCCCWLSSEGEGEGDGDEDKGVDERDPRLSLYNQKESKEFQRIKGISKNQKSFKESKEFQRISKNQYKRMKMKNIWGFIYIVYLFY